VCILKAREIVSIINEILETTWSDSECVTGKQVDVAPEWRSYMKQLVQQYRTAGWDVQRRIEIMSTYPRNPRDFLVFKNPQFIKAGKERFEAKYGK
jgi:hypothetical protein